MGFWDSVRLGSSVADLMSVEPVQPNIVTAADTNYTNPNTWWWDGTNLPVSRAEAMSVPAIARARNIMCGTVGALPLERYSDMNGRHLSSIPLYYQPDPASPRSVTYTWIADSLLFYGVAFVQILETYAEDNRPSRFRWVDPGRVTPQYNANNTMIVGYQLDGNQLPSSGVGSLIAFQGTDEGLLNRAGRTIRTAIELEKAANRAASEPMPTTVLKSTGIDLPGAQITELLTRWKRSRQERSTAYLSSGLEMQAIGFDPKSQQLVEARQFIASEIARACSIPAWYLNAETASMTYSNTEQERRTLIDFSIMPLLLKPIEDRLSMLDVAPRAVSVRFDLEEFFRGSAMERLEVTAKLLELGLITIPQAMEREDLSPEGGPDA